MKFLVVAQLPARLAQRLIEVGHDAVHTIDLPEANRTPAAIGLRAGRTRITARSSGSVRREKPRVGQTEGMPWYRVANAEAPWGDYGDMLHAGMLTHRDSDGVVGVERTGPFAPPIYVGTRDILIATTDTRDVLERTGLTGFHFRPTVMKRIVRLEWRHWDFNAEDPERYPAGCEPENYVLGRKHNPKVAQEIGPLWEVHVDGVFADGVEADLVRSLPTEYCGYLLASDRAHDVLAAEYGNWLRFDVHTV